MEKADGRRNQESWSEPRGCFESVRWKEGLELIVKSLG